MDFTTVIRLKQIKDEGLFTKSQSLYQYVEGVKFRIKEYYGYDASDWSLNDIVEFLDTTECSRINWGK